MADIDITFHATPEELTEWVQAWADADGIWLVAEMFPPISFTPIASDEVPAAIANPAVSRISFLTEPFDSSIKYQSDFCDRYSHQLALDIGRLTPDGLGESWLACRTDDEEAYMLWKGIAKDLKARTNAGITAINRQNGATGFYRRHRYSDGAKALESDGVEILGLPGPGKGPMLRLGDARKKTTSEQST